MTNKYLVIFQHYDKMVGITIWDTDTVNAHKEAIEKINQLYFEKKKVFNYYYGNSFCRFTNLDDLNSSFKIIELTEPILLEFMQLTFDLRYSFSKFGIVPDLHEMDFED